MVYITQLIDALPPCFVCIVVVSPVKFISNYPDLPYSAKCNLEHLQLLIASPNAVLQSSSLNAKSLIDLALQYSLMTSWLAVNWISLIPASTDPLGGG